MQIQPQKNFTIVRQIADSTDATTFYVRAVIRNAYTDTIIDTVDLTDKGSQRFKYDWTVPADPSGEGFYISIITDVYSDSGYTTKSPIFETEEDTYLVYDRIKGTAGGKGGAGVDYFRIREIIKEELTLLEEKEAEKEKEEPMEDKSEHHNKVEELLNEIKAKKHTCDCPKVDLKPVLKAIKEIDIPDIKPIVDATKVDLNPILNKIKGAEENTQISRKETKLLLKQLEYRLNEKLRQLRENEELDEDEEDEDLTELAK